MNQQPNINSNTNNNGEDALPSAILIQAEGNVEGEEIQQEEVDEGGGGEEEDPQEEEEGDSVLATPTLQMNGQEEGWAWNLVKWMEGEDPDCNGKNQQAGGKVPNDFEYALHAIGSKGSKERADRKIRAMQQFRQKYKIQDTVEEGVQAFRDFIRFQPGHLLHLDALDSQGALIALDFSKFFPSRIRASEENQRIWFVFWYYVFQVCAATNIDVLRGGVRLLIETTGMSHQNMDIGLEQQMFQDLFFCAPVNWTEIRAYNTTQLVASFVELLKHFMPDEMRDVVSVGCTLEITGIHDPTGTPALNRILNAVRPNPRRLTLPQFFVQPNYDAAMQNLMTKVKTRLEDRYRNEKSFELFLKAMASTLE